jgi:hypothetical protein
MYLCRELTDDSFPVIGESFGRDHSTVIHAHNLITHRVADDSPFRDLLNKLGRDLKKGAGKPERELAEQNVNDDSSVLITTIRKCEE